METLIIVQIIGITFILNGQQIGQKWPINSDFYATGRRGQNIFGETWKVAMKVTDQVWINNFNDLQKKKIFQVLEIKHIETGVSAKVIKQDISVGDNLFCRVNRQFRTALVIDG